MTLKGSDLPAEAGNRQEEAPASAGFAGRPCWWRWNVIVFSSYPGRRFIFWKRARSKSRRITGLKCRAALTDKSGPPLRGISFLWTSCDSFLLFSCLTSLHFNALNLANKDFLSSLHFSPVVRRMQNVGRIPSGVHSALRGGGQRRHMRTSPFLEEDLRLSAGEGGLTSVHLSGNADSRWRETPAGIFALGCNGHLAAETSAEVKGSP